jgi:hypothetical protein
MNLRVIEFSANTFPVPVRCAKPRAFPRLRATLSSARLRELAPLSWPRRPRPGILCPAKGGNDDGLPRLTISSYSFNPSWRRGNRSGASHRRRISSRNRADSSGSAGDDESAAASEAPSIAPGCIGSLNKLAAESSLRLTSRGREELIKSAIVAPSTFRT